MKKPELLLLVAVIMISVLGLIMIYSSSYIWAEYKYGDSLKYFKNQGLFLIIGIILMMIVSKIDYGIYFKKANIILFICMILLVLVIIPGVGTIRNGSRSWFGIGPLGIQPSEFTKLGLIIFTSKFLSKNDKAIKTFKGILPLLLLIILIFGLIMLQPDFGTGSIIVMSIVGILFVAGLDMKFFIRSGLVGIVGVVGLILAAPYRMSRILSYLNPWSDPLGTGFQIIQSLYAIGPGRPPQKG